MVGRFGWAGLVLLAAAAGVHGQDTCIIVHSDSSSVNCKSTPLRTVLPTAQQYGNHSVEAITGTLHLTYEALTEIEDGGFDTCPYTAVTKLLLDNNDITTVGARAFENLPELTTLGLVSNAITWMAATSLNGIIKLEQLNLYENRIEAFDYGALTHMTALFRLVLSNQQGGGDISCNGKNSWSSDADGIKSAIASCGASGSPCYDNAVACPENQTTFPSTPTTTATTIDDGSTSTLGAGAIAGIVVGTLALIGAGVYVF